ncbi:hypothetical protein [Thermococcus sp.]
MELAKKRESIVYSHWMLVRDISLWRKAVENIPKHIVRITVRAPDNKSSM